MTDDLIKRLRSPEVFIDTGGMFSPVANEAADELERAWALLEAGGGRYWEGRYRDEAALVDKLEAALQKICDSQRDADKSYPELLAELRIEARAALAGEKKDE